MHNRTFLQLDHLLLQSRSLWQLRSFECQTLPWENEFPNLAAKVWCVNDDEIDEIDADHQQLFRQLTPALAADIAQQGLTWELDLLLGNSQLFPYIESKQVCDITDIDINRLSAGIKGRKWQQIDHFSNHVLHQKDVSYLEWCAGKGHLGRLLAKRSGKKVLSLEWQNTLCIQGQELAHKHQVEQQFICADAFDSQQNLLEVNHHAVALHACGDLHTELLKHVINVGANAVSIAPCCYHLIRNKQYRPLSEVAKESRLSLSTADLRLPLQHSVIANQKQQQLRSKEVAWRLGFDCLQKACRQTEEYLPLPTIKQSQLSGRFDDFCQWGAEQKGINLGCNIDFSKYLQQGLKRQALTRRIDLVAHLFRYALEKWLILDRATFLQENGYDIDIGLFCKSTITPRNVLITGERRNNHSNL
ncbi:MAG: methyltransferase [Parashewanella sp.]